MSRPVSRPVQVEIVNGQLMTNRPSAFANAFYLPSMPGGDSGMTRVSHTVDDIAADTIASLVGRKGGRRNA